MITIGDHTIIPVLDSVIRRDPTKLYPTTTAAMWETVPEHVAPDGHLEFFMGGYVLRSGDPRRLPPRQSARCGFAARGLHRRDLHAPAPRPHRMAIA